MFNSADATVKKVFDKLSCHIKELQERMKSVEAEKQTGKEVHGFWLMSRGSRYGENIP